MKAAIIYQKGDLPQYADVENPIVFNDDEMMMHVKAVAIKHIDKSVASGKHYSVEEIKNARIIGGDGVGILEDGTKIFAFGETGTMAEMALIRKNTIVKLPHGINDSVAAALPNAVAGSAMGMRFRANMQKGETILINGATGFTGRVAVQIAKHYGAKKIIVTGRNEQALNSLLSLGADEIILLSQNENDFLEQIKTAHKNAGIDIVIDYLWGHSAELILDALKGKGNFTHRTRFVSIGAMTGDKIQLSAEILRSANLQLIGSGLGSWTRDEVKPLFSEIIPEMFQLAADGKLKIETLEVNLKDIEDLWQMEIPSGKRLVVKI